MSEGSHVFKFPGDAANLLRSSGIEFGILSLQLSHIEVGEFARGITLLECTAYSER